MRSLYVKATGVSRRPPMTPRARRGWGIGILVFFVVMCAMIAWSQWYAVNVNVPFYQSQHAPAKKP